MASSTKQQVRARTRAFTAALDRAEYLLRALADSGYTTATDDASKPKATPAKLSVTEQRDVAQFVFFEAAALFEELARDLFEVEVRGCYGIAPRHAKHVMGSSDRGTEHVFGWGDPATIQKRAKNLGLSKMHDKLRARVGGPTYDALIAAHRLRNRIAHGPGVKRYDDVMGWAYVPKKERKGCGPGRLLLDYGKGNRAFAVLLAAYRRYASVADSLLP